MTIETLRIIQIICGIFMTNDKNSPSVAIIGAGPAGLMAAEVISQQGITVHVFDRMPSVARKFLLAGIGGLNITHSEPYEQFCERYLPKHSLTPFLQIFGVEQLLQWCHGLGIDTFIGSSGRIFPKEMKAAPLLRAWLKRLRQQGVQFHLKHTWQGWDKDHHLVFQSSEGISCIAPDATLLALGGASYPRLGSDGTWINDLQTLSIQCNPWQPANCGFETAPWSAIFTERYAGIPVKAIACYFVDKQGNHHHKLGEIMLTRYGVEGSAIYSLSQALRETINQQGSVTLHLDLFPKLTRQELQAKLTKPQGKQSLSNFLRKQINLKDIKMGLVRELASESLQDITTLADKLKAIPLTLTKPRPITEAISSAGGICLNELNNQLMLKKSSGVFCAGEMLDWEAPTGGYLLTGCFSTGYCAGIGIIDWLAK